MSRIDATFAALRDRKRTALIPYVTVGDPHADGTPELLLAMAQAGADIIELGIPLSDPMADGPVVQKASERALARGIGMKQVLSAVAEFRRQDPKTPIVLVAGGTGFAPVKAIVEHFMALGTRRPMRVYWGARQAADIYLREQAER